MTQTSFITYGSLSMPPGMPFLSPDHASPRCRVTGEALADDANQSLQAAADRYWPDTPTAREAACELLTKFTRAVTRIETLVWASDRIKNALAPCRRIFAESVFMKRCQVWPRGYAGDFETIEYLAGAVNGSKPGTIAWHFEQILLESPVTQQHRNKLTCQESWNSG